MSFEGLFSAERPVIGMVHLLALPGAPGYAGDLDIIYARACEDAQTLLEAGVDGLIVENFSDEPFHIGEPDVHDLALMAAITRELVRTVTIPVGVNVQFNAWQAEVAIAHTCRAQFVRVEVFVDRVLTATGVVEPCAAQITRYRAALGARCSALGRHPDQVHHQHGPSAAHKISRRCAGGWRRRADRHWRGHGQRHAPRRCSVGEGGRRFARARR